jgi:carbonic anhydrase
MTEGSKVDRLCELNVLEQAANVSRTTIVQDAWRRGQPLEVHGWIYRLQNGLIRDLGMSVARDAMLDEVLERSLRGLAG